MQKNYIDIGDGGGVLISDIICVIDADEATKSNITKKFIKKNNEEKNTVIPKKMISKINSLVITENHGNLRIYSSPMTLKLFSKRANEKEMML